MAYGCRHNDSLTIQRYDMQGCRTVAKQRYDAASTDTAREFYAGVMAVFDTCLRYEWRDQSEFFTLLDLWSVDDED